MVSMSESLLDCPSDAHFVFQRDYLWARQSVMTSGSLMEMM